MSSITISSLETLEDPSLIANLCVKSGWLLTSVVIRFCVFEPSILVVKTDFPLACRTGGSTWVYMAI